MKFKVLILPFMFSLFSSLPLSAENTEMIFLANGGYSENIFLDSTSQPDAFASPMVIVNHYPSSSARLNFSAGYTAYRTLSDLNRFHGGAGLTLVSAAVDRPLSLYCSADADVNTYGQDYDVYDNVQADLSIAAHLELVDGLVFKLGGTAYGTRYSNARYADYYGLELAGGLNATLPGNNSINTEAGYARTRFRVQSDVRGSFIPGPYTFYDMVSCLETGYYSIRFSRPLARHTGITLAYATHTFLNMEGDAVCGFSVDILSPWRKFYDGAGISAKIKSFAVPGIIASAGFNHQDRKFINTIEQDGDDRFYIVRRRDRQNDLFIEIQRPVGRGGRMMIVPSIYAGYVKNDSTDPAFKYESISVSVGLKVQM